MSMCRDTLWRIQLNENAIHTLALIEASNDAKKAAASLRHKATAFANKYSQGNTKKCLELNISWLEALQREVQAELDHIARLQ